LLIHSVPIGPLSAYNLFFQLERERLLSGETGEIRVFTPEDVSNMVIMHANKPKRPHRKTHGKIGFADLARTIAGRWKTLDKTGRMVFEERARLEKARYRVKVADWLERQTVHKSGGHGCHGHSISHNKMLMTLMSLEAQEQQDAAAAAAVNNSHNGNNSGKIPVTPPTPTKPTSTKATVTPATNNTMAGVATNTHTMARKVSLASATATSSPESPLSPMYNKNGTLNFNNNIHHHNRMMMMNVPNAAGAAAASFMNNTSSNSHNSTHHVVPLYTPPYKSSQCSAFEASTSSSFATGTAASCSNGGMNNNNKNNNNNLRDLLSEGDAYLREDSHLARLQKLHAMQVQMEQELNQMAMEQGYFPTTTTATNLNYHHQQQHLHHGATADATPFHATSMGGSGGGATSGIFHNGGFNNDNSNSFAAIHLPSTMGVNGVTLPALPPLSSSSPSQPQHLMSSSATTMTANHFLMPKQLEQQQDHCSFAPFVSQLQMNEQDDNDDHHHSEQPQQQHDIVPGDEWAHATFDPRADLTTPTQELDLIDDDGDDDDTNSHDNDEDHHDTHGDLHWF
jgi:hypothetical protein